jgi:hypothetical protein
VIDLHLHTTASDGRSSPAELVRAAARAGIRVLAVTDHDTTAGLDLARREADVLGLALVAGIEITAVDEGRDIHVLGYFFDAGDPALARFLASQRDDRRRRLVEMVGRLDRLGVPIDAAPILDAARGPGGRALGRPLLARALVEAGHVGTVSDAFDRYLGAGRPAFVARTGAPPADVVRIVAEAGGLASIAHPGKIGDDDLVGRLLDEGMPAIEVFHPDHSEADVARYAALARSRARPVTGGSDYHGPDSGRESGLGRVGLPAAEYERLVEHAERRA